MLETNDLNIKNQKPEIFERKKLRPWDDPVNFIPSKIFDKTNNNEKNLYNESAIGKPIGKQLVNPLVNNNVPIGKQLVNPLVNNLLSIGKQENAIDNPLVNNKITIGKPIGKQKSNGLPAKLDNRELDCKYGFNVIKQLSGLQKKALFYIVDDCKTEGKLHTSPITNEFLRNLLNTDINSVKTTIYRLVKKELIGRMEGKRGNGGYSIFYITETVRNIVLEINRQLDLYNKLSFCLQDNKESIGKPLVNALVNPLVNSSNVVSSNINITTTNVPEDFKRIDFSSLSGYGLDESHIIQIYREYSKKPELSLSAEIIQNSIYALAFDLKHNNVAGSFKHSPAVVLTALLKKGQPYSSKTPDKVLNPREEAMQEYIIAQEKRHYKIQELENKAKEFELQEWLKSLSEQELVTFMPQDLCPEGMPEKIYQTSRRKKALATAKEYFTTIIWPQKLNQLEELKQTPKLEKDVI
jgi:predicted transcriptional regulator